jgi:hypothetical protein
MLTKTDLRQIEGVVNKVVKKELGAGLGEVRKEFSVGLGEVRKEFKKELAPIKKDITKIRSDISTMSSFFDNEYLHLRSRVEKIEEHIGFSSA